jgi:hypothetical protein
MLTRVFGGFRREIFVRRYGLFHRWYSFVAARRTPHAARRTPHAARRTRDPLPYFAAHPLIPSTS